MKILVVSGCSGVGKDTILNKLMEHRGDMKKLVSYTTRGIRPGEKPGLDYIFLNTHEEFHQLVKENRLLETIFYDKEWRGTQRPDEKDDKTIQFYNVEPNGMLKIREFYPDAVTVFIAPPSREHLMERMRNRKETEEKIAERMATVDNIMSYANRYDYVVVNDDLNTAVQKILNIIKSEFDDI